MGKRVLVYFADRLAGLRRDEGFVVMSTLAIFLFIFILCAFVYAVGETIHQRIKLQNACDAAAYSAAVVQADGLSRMAVVNKAMSWSYVQMTNRQMDYATYRWLKLTCTRFDEDKNNAYQYAAQLTLCADPELGPYAVLEAAISAVASIVFQLDCSTGAGHKRDPGAGRSWWCGLHKGTDEEIDFNPKKLAESATLSGTGKKAVDEFAKGLLKIRKKSFVEKLINPIGKVVDSGNGRNPHEWGARLGFWIDCDKKNIENLNKSLHHINNQMNHSMRVTAESVLKSMLKDSRIDSSRALDDYYISIHIPQGKDPYEEDAEEISAAPGSFFSPLRNTEADEMLFLNMPSAEKVDIPLAAHFETLAGGELGYGLDQWFIRGKGEYSDGKDHCYDSQSDSQPSYRGGQSGHLLASANADDDDGGQNGHFFAGADDGVRLTGTSRDEGSLGIQRVYKDANLNETEAGFITTSSGSKYPVSRGNHLFDLTSWTKTGLDYVTRLFSGTAQTDRGSEDEGISVEELFQEYRDGIDQRESEIGKLEADNASLSKDDPQYQQKLDENNRLIQQKRGEIADYKKYMENVGDNPLSQPGGGLGGGGLGGGGGSSGGDSSGDGGSSGGSSIVQFFGKFVTNMLSSIANQFIDISPSCGNAPVDKPNRKNFMCRSVNSTAALYAEYRWASSKWYCCTTWKAYLLSLIFDPFSQQIYCDFGYHTFGHSPLGKAIKARGWGHYPFFPKAFCGRGPVYPLDGLFGKVPGLDYVLEVLPPIAPDIPISDPRHGYMESTWDFDGLIYPLKDLTSKTKWIPRDKYESCAVFPDGAFEFMDGSASAGYIQGHARIYGDDKELFNNRYVGARCKPWVLNERFFAGDGTIVIGAAMKHTNPLVQLMNYWNPNAGTQNDAERTVLSAFNIPKGNYMWTMSAARAAVRHTRRNGDFDQERQYQITYDSSSDTENLSYDGPAYVFRQDGENWVKPEDWGSAHSDNPHSISRFYNPDEKQEEIPIWNGCPCKQNSVQFRNLWNLCETDWDATLIPLRYATRKAVLYTDEGSRVFNELEHTERCEFVQKDEKGRVIGKGESWIWNPLDAKAIVLSPFIMNGWKRADAPFFEDKAQNYMPGIVSTALSAGAGDLDLNSQIPTGKKEKTVNVFTILKDKVL